MNGWNRQKIRRSYEAGKQVAEQVHAPEHLLVVVVGGGGLVVDDAADGRGENCP